MRAPLRRALLPLAAVIALLAVLGVTALAKGKDIWPGGATAATPPASTGGAGSARASSSDPGPGPGAGPGPGGGSTSAPVAAGSAARKGTVATTDALFIWTGRDARVPADAVGEQVGPGARVLMQLGLRLTVGSGRGLATVSMRNPTGKPVALAGTVQLLVTGPGAPVVVRQPVRVTVPAARASTVRLGFRPSLPGVYRVRAIFVPS